MTELQTTIESITGFQVAGVACGLKPEGKRDLAVITSDRLCAVAGVFTTNELKAASVLLNQERLAKNQESVRAVLINAGNANACTGTQGLENARQTTQWVAEEFEYAPEDVLAMSTGVIGMQLPVEKIERGIIDSAIALRADAWSDAAEAIMTTDQSPKMASVRVQAEGGTYTVAGIAKGAGMIAPNMATMLCAIVTDLGIDAPTLQTTLQTANDASFNRIVVDGDMSTNDTVLVLANGASGVHVESGAALKVFQDALKAVCVHLAQSIVRDGEGATRFIVLEVCGAPDEAAARQVAMTIATSPLVKTAFYGADANWGRILAAAGRSGVPLDPEKLSLWFMAGEDGALGGLQLVKDGTPTDYSEALASDIAEQPSISVLLDLGLGQAETTIWTCDLSHEYININADYRT